jgi:hypothetical protein
MTEGQVETKKTALERSYTSNGNVMYMREAQEEQLCPCFIWMQKP